LFSLGSFLITEEDQFGGGASLIHGKNFEVIVTKNG
jgi:hypothetical protein